MTIYQLHEYSGEYEDFHDYIIGSYLRKERAEEEKVKAEAREKQLRKHSKKCNRCPLIGSACDFDFDSLNLDDLLSKYPNYCTRSKLEKTEYGVNCANYYIHWDESRFEVKEVEVEE